MRHITAPHDILHISLSSVCPARTTRCCDRAGAGEPRPAGSDHSDSLPEEGRGRRGRRGRRDLISPDETVAAVLRSDSAPLGASRDRRDRRRDWMSRAAGATAVPWPSRRPGAMAATSAGPGPPDNSCRPGLQAGSTPRRCAGKSMLPATGRLGRRPGKAVKVIKFRVGRFRMCHGRGADVGGQRYGRSR